MPARCHQCGKGGTKGKQATYGIPGKKGERACSIHKKKRMVDIKNPRCQQETCNKQAGFGLEGGKKSFCNGHKEDGMVDLTHKKCVSNGCGQQARYGPKGGPKTLCTKHHRHQSEQERVDMTPEQKPEVRAAGTVRVVVLV